MHSCFWREIWIWHVIKSVVSSAKKIQFFSISDLILDLCEQHKQKIKINVGLDLLFHGNTNSDTGNFATGCILKLELQLKTNEFVWP